MLPQPAQPVGVDVDPLRAVVLDRHPAQLRIVAVRRVGLVQPAPGRCTPGREVAPVIAGPLVVLVGIPREHPLFVDGDVSDDLEQGQPQHHDQADRHQLELHPSRRAVHRRGPRPAAGAQDRPGHGEQQQTTDPAGHGRASRGNLPPGEDPSHDRRQAGQTQCPDERADDEQEHRRDPADQRWAGSIHFGHIISPQARLCRFLTTRKAVCRSPPAAS